MIATLLVFQLGAVTAQTDVDATSGDDTAAPQSTTPARVEPAPAAPAETEKVPAPAASVETEKAPAAVPAAEPIRGAFGIPLGERFEAPMVARVLDQQEQIYRGADGVELKGTLIHVEPRQPDQRFQRYAVKTTSDGVIYAIQGDYQFEVEQAKGKQVGVKKARVVRSTCKDAVKALAREFEGRYGKPRGKGWDGEWFAFRQFTENTDKSLRLYANRCRSGIYSVVYTDQAAIGIQAKPKKQPQQQKEQKEQEQEQEQVPESEQKS